ncbi:MAG: hypothetical protein ChlgKO_13950 [Chlamydiales bacterium]
MSVQNTTFRTGRLIPDGPQANPVFATQMQEGKLVDPDDFSGPQGDVSDDFLKCKPNRDVVAARKAQKIAREYYRCPITKEPFSEPYFCVEDHYTYEKAAIISYVESKLNEYIEAQNYSKYILSPKTSVPLTTITLIPNNVLGRGTETITYDLVEISKNNLPQRTFRTPLFNSHIRKLITDFNEEKDDSITLINKIEEERIRIGLEAKGKTLYCPKHFRVVNLSLLDLSNMQINLGMNVLKAAIIEGADFSGSTLKGWFLPNMRLTACKMKATKFVKCFFSQTTQFEDSDIKNAVMINCHMEGSYVGSTISNPSWIRDALTLNGALNAATITFQEVEAVP